MNTPFSYTETTTIRQNLIILNDEIVSLSNIKNVKKTIHGFDPIIKISYHDDPNSVSLCYENDNFEQRNIDFEDIAKCLGLGDSI